MALADAVPFAVAAWTLDEASGTRADSVGSNDLTDNNTVTSGTGKFDSAADFERDNSEYLSIADNADLSFDDDDFCISLWVKFESLNTGGGDAGQRVVLSKGTNSGTGEYSLFLNTSDVLVFNIQGTTGFTQSTDASASNFGALSTGTWYLVVFWHDSVANEVGISINGTANTAAHSTGCHDAAGTFYLGAGYPWGDGPGRFHDGLIDDVVVLVGYILDSTEISELYNGGTGVAFADWAGGATFVPFPRPRGLKAGMYSMSGGLV